MTQIVQQPYNMFATPKLKKPVQVYDPTKSVDDNMAGKGNPSAQNIIAAYQTPQAQLQQAQSQNQTKDQQPKQQFNGDPNSSTAGMDYLNSLYTSPQEEERLRKASVMNQRILAVGDAIRHIGNIANTVRYAPAQQFNNPVAEEQARYEKGKAMRDRANQQFYSYQQQKASQEARMKQLSDAADLKLKQLAFNQDKFNRQQSLNEFKAKNDDWYKRATIGQKEQALEIQRQLAEGRISLMEAQEALARVKTSQGGFAPRKGSSGRGGSGGGKYWAYDQEGNIHYYPNKSMYEQGVYEFSQGQNRNEEYKKGTDAFGNPISGVRRTPVTSLGGERARQAKQKKTNGKKANPMGGSSNGKKKNPMS